MKLLPFGIEKKCVLAATNNGGRNWVTARAVRKKGRLNIIGLEKKAGDFHPRGLVAISVGARQSYILREEFPTRDQRLLNLQVSRKLKQIGLWSDAENLYNSIKNNVKPNGQNQVTAIALPGSEFEPVLDQLSCAKGARPMSIVPCEAAVAGLLGELTMEPVLSIYFSENYVKLLITLGKLPLSIQLVPVSEEGIGQDLLEYNVEKALDHGRKLCKDSVEKIVAFGSAPTDLPPVINGITLWKPDWRKIVETEDPQAVTRYPSLFGALFSDPDFDMRPSGWKLAYRLQSLSNVISGAAAAGIAIFATCSLMLHGYNTTLKKRQDGYRAALTAREKTLKERLPKAEQIKMVRQWVELKQKYEAEPKLYYLIGQLAKSLPAGVKVLNMKISRPGRKKMELNPTPGNAVQPPLPQASDVQNSTPHGPLGIMGRAWESEIVFITQGDFSQADSRLKEAVTRLQAYFQLKDVKRTYDESKQRGILSLKMKARNNQTS